METTTYFLVRALSQTASELGDALKEKHPSTLHVDKTCFAGEGMEFRVDTYQVLNFYWRGYVTINIYFFRPDMAKDDLQIKVSLFSSYWKSPTRLMKQLQKEIEGVILGLR